MYVKFNIILDGEVVNTVSVPSFNPTPEVVAVQLAQDMHGENATVEEVE